jgi:hypothetical protein
MVMSTFEVQNKDVQQAPIMEPCNTDGCGYLPADVTTVVATEPTQMFNQMLNQMLKKKVIKKVIKCVEKDSDDNDEEEEALQA